MSQTHTPRVSGGSGGTGGAGGVGSTGTATGHNLSSGVRPGEHKEGPVARAIEQQTTKLPSDTFLWAAGGAIVGSLALQLLGQDKQANFVGQWAPTLLILGLYNKLVKIEGSD